MTDQSRADQQLLLTEPVLLIGYEAAVDAAVGQPIDADIGNLTSKIHILFLRVICI